MVRVDVQYALSDQVLCQAVPTEDQFKAWASAIDATKRTDEDVVIRVVDEAEIAALNSKYRKKTQSTNVLAFPAEIPAGTDLPFIGDIVICAPIVAKQAAEQGKSLDSHWAHLTLHGILHLQGYDHTDDAEAKIMENLEVQLMNKLGFSNPYV